MAPRVLPALLSGVGGDELFGGYRRYLGGHYAATFHRLPGWLRALVAGTARELPAGRHSGALNGLRLAKGFMDATHWPKRSRRRALATSTTTCSAPTAPTR